jgi:hypothetical protein
VKRLVDLIGMTAAGTLGWIAGAGISVFTAFIVSVVASGLGLWATRHFLTRHLP